MKNYVLIVSFITSWCVLGAMDSDIKPVDPYPHSPWEDDAILCDYIKLRDGLKEGTTILHKAVKKGKVSLVRIALYHDKDAINKKDAYGNTPLHVAISKQQWDCANLLLQNGASINERGEFGYTALHLAAIKGDELGLRYCYFVAPNDLYKMMMGA